MFGLYLTAQGHRGLPTAQLAKVCTRLFRANVGGDGAKLYDKLLHTQEAAAVDLWTGGKLAYS